MLLTARPDLLPIDLKRQGRAEVHIPLFYPTDEAEIRQLFVVLAKKLGSSLKAEDIPPIPQRGQLSGADIEGMVGRAWRLSLLAGADHVTKRRWRTSSRSSCRRRRGSSASCRKSPRFSSARTASSSRRRPAIRSPPTADAGNYRRG